MTEESSESLLKVPKIGEKTKRHDDQMETSNPNDLEQIENKKTNFSFFNRTRIVVLAISLLCITCTQSNSISMNFTVICMNDVIIEQKGNSSELHWLEDSSQVSMTFSAVAIGSFIGIFPSVPLISKFGVRNVLTIYGLLSSFGTLFMPLFVSMGLYPVLFARILQGFGNSIMFTVIGAISESWSRLSEISTYVAFLSSALQLSAIITMPVAGVLCESDLTWRALYYGLGSVSFIAYIAFFLFYTNSPDIHRNVSSKELRKISVGKAPKATGGVPYRAVCKDRVIQAVWLSAIGGNLGFLLLNYYGPTYLNKVLNYDARSTGFANMLPYILSAIIKFVAGPASDKATCISERSRVIIVAAVSQGGLAICYVVMALTDSAAIAQGAYTAAILLSGVNVIGVVKCAQMVARQYIHFVMAVISFTVCVITFVLPIVVAIFCPENTKSQWSWFFIAIAAIIILTNAPFPLFASANAAEYTKAGWKETVTKNRDDNVVPVDNASKA